MLLPCAAVVALALSAEPWLEFDGCEELDASTLVDLTELEIQDVPERLRVRVSCQTDSFAITVDDESKLVSERRVPRTAATGEVPERYLALEIAELIEVSQHTPEAVRVVPPTQPPPEPPAPGPRRRGFVSVGPRAELGGQPAMLSGGGIASVGGRVWRHLTLRADVVASGGARPVDGKTVRTGALWGAGVLLATFDVGRAELHAGGGARVGGVWIRGLPPADSPLQGRVHRGWSWSPQASFAVAWRVGRAAFVGLGVDAGWTLRPVRGFTATELVFATGGPWVGLGLNIGGRFGA